MRVIIGVICVAFLLAYIFERPTLRGCQCRCALGRVKPLCTLTLPCQKTNPDGVICRRVVAEVGWLGKQLGVSVCKVGSCGVICGYMVVKMGWLGKQLGISVCKIGSCGVICRHMVTEIERLDLGLVASERSIMF